MTIEQQNTLWTYSLVVCLATICICTMAFTFAEVYSTLRNQGATVNRVELSLQTSAKKK